MDSAERKELHQQETLWHQRAMDRMSELETRVAAQRKAMNVMNDIVAECESTAEQLGARLDAASKKYTELSKRVEKLEKEYES